jgi:hypothetical protein
MMPRRRNYSYSDRTCQTCGNDISDLPDNYKYCTGCYSPTSSYSGSRRGTAGLKRCSLCGEILTTEQYDKGYDYHLECYKKIKK